MNWGKSIFLVYGAFVVFMIGMVTFCIKQDNIHLVSKDYYKEEIEYQVQMDKIKNAQNLKDKLGFEYNGKSKEVTFSYPQELSEANGEIVFFRPSDARKDTKVPVKVNESFSQKVSVDQLESGLWKVKVYMSALGKDYYNEQVLVIQ